MTNKVHYFDHPLYIVLLMYYSAMAQDNVYTAVSCFDTKGRALRYAKELEENIGETEYARYNPTVVVKEVKEISTWNILW